MVFSLYSWFILNKIYIDVLIKAVFFFSSLVLNRKSKQGNSFHEMQQHIVGTICYTWGMILLIFCALCFTVVLCESQSICPSSKKYVCQKLQYFVYLDITWFIVCKLLVCILICNAKNHRWNLCRPPSSHDTFFTWWLLYVDTRYMVHRKCSIWYFLSTSMN